MLLSQEATELEWTVSEYVVVWIFLMHWFPLYSAKSTFRRSKRIFYFKKTFSIVPYCEKVDCNIEGAGLKYWECKPAHKETQEVGKPIKDKIVVGKRWKCSQKKRKCLKDCKKSYSKNCHKIGNKNFRKKRNCKQCWKKCGNKSNLCLHKNFLIFQREF